MLSLKGANGDDITQCAIQNYLGSNGSGSLDKRILERGESINASAALLKEELIEYIEKYLEKMK